MSINLDEIEACARSWEPATCLLGNVTARDILEWATIHRKQVDALLAADRYFKALERDNDCHIGLCAKSAGYLVDQALKAGGR